MYYSECLSKLLKERKNPVNKMYLHEINIKWQIFEKLAKNKKDDSLESLVEALNSFIKALSNKKYLYNSSTRNGFPQNSPIFSGVYLDDLISLMVRRTGVLEKSGVYWGVQSFDTGVRFNSILSDNEKDTHLFTKDKSTDVLSLIQKFDIQLRIHGKRNFEKHFLSFPILSFFTFNILSEDDFIKTEYFANLAKQSNSKVKTLIVCEYLDDGYSPIIKGTSIDSIFVLRKGHKSKAMKKLDVVIIKELYKRIKYYLMDQMKKAEDLAKKGIIE